MRARSLDIAVRANTQNFESGMRSVSRAMKGAILGMNAVAAAASGQEKSMIGMINAVAIGFATGGPWGAAIAGAGIGLGMLIGKVKEAEKQWTESMQAMASATKGLWDEVQKAEEHLFVTGGGDLIARRLADKMMELELAKDQLRMARARLESAPEGPAGAVAGFLGIGERAQAQEAVERARKTSGELSSQVKALERLLDLSRQQADQDQTAERAKQAAKDLEEQLRRIPLSTQVAADSVFALLDGIIVRGMKASDVLRSVLMNIASIGLRVGINSAFGIATT